MARAKVRHRAGMRRKKFGAFPTATGGIARLAYQYAKEAGLNVNRLLKQSELTAWQIADDSIRVPVENQIKFLNVVADAMQDELLGLRLARQVDLRKIGLLYYVLASSPTLTDALLRVARYSGINNEGVRITFRQRRDASIAFQYSGVSRMSDRHQIEFFAAVLVRIVKHLVGRELKPESVGFMHRRSEFSPDFKAFFRCSVAFGGDVDEVVYRNSFMTLPVVSSDPYLNRMLVKYCEEAISERRAKSSDWRHSVENSIAQLLPHGQARLPEVCRQLGVTPRTLSRRLATEGSTFAGVLDALRQDLAKRYLREPGLQISEIAWLLGYRQASSFNHAFKRWTGKMPSRLRH